MKRKSTKIIITDNYLDKDFQKLLLPLRCIHHLLFSSKFSIEYNCIRPHTVLYYIFSLIGITGFIVFHLSKLNPINSQGVNSEAVEIIMKIHVSVLVTSYILFYIINFMQRRNHVDMLLKIQKAYRIINYKYNTRLIFWHWFDMFRPVSFLIINMVFIPDFTIFLHLCTLVYFDVQVGYGISIAKMLKRGTESWMSELETFCKFNLELGEEKYSEHFKKLFQAYEYLLEAYEIFKTIFKYSILFQALDTFFHSLVFVKGLVEVAKSGATHIGVYHVGEIQLVATFWLWKNISLVSIFSAYTEYFYISISEINSICTRWSMAVQNLVEAKKLCKNVLRLNRAAFHKMTACRIFTVDAGLAQAFNNLEVEYICILLQIALKHTD